MMKRILPAATLLLLYLGPNKAYSQAPGCANIVAPADFTLPCSTPCTTLTSVPFHVGQTTSYTVSSVPFTPVVPFTDPGTPVSAGTDDVWSPIITLPFPFCFYGVAYTTCKVGSNGSIMLGPAAGGGGCPWSFSASCPSTALTGAGNIFGVYHDIDPSVCGTIRYSVVGSAPCRTLVVNFNSVCHFSCTSIKSTHQIVLYETTNVIEVYVASKPTCGSWNGGRAIIGIQNPAGTAGIAAPGRNSSPTWTVTTGEGWRFTPNGTPIYTTSWYQGATLLATGNTVTVCPTATTTYTAKVQYTRCDGLIINDQDDITISLAPLPAPTVSTTAETCMGYNNGQVVINNAAGPGPFTVNITGPTTGSVVEPNTAAGTATFTNLPDGAYNYTVTSAAGCTYSGTFTIGAGPPCCSVTASGTNVSCFGGSTGTVTANPTGMAGYTYSWTTSPVQTTQTATGLPSGTYTVTMTDAVGCTATANVTVTQPTVITASTTAVNPLCNGGTNGSVTVTASGGTGALTYSINGGPFVASPSFTGLPAGSYTIVVKDANGCTQTVTATLTNPPVVVATLSGTTPATCGSSNGTITVTGSGGTGTLTYSNGGAFQPTGSFTSLASGTYTVTVKDANGCTATVSATVGSSAGPSASIISQTNLSCAGGANGSVLLGATGGTSPFTYSIDLSGPTPATPFQASNSFTGLVAGTYTATVKDANGCTGTVNFTITAPTALTYTSTATAATCNGVCDGQISITPSGGTAPYQYSSNNGLSFSPSSPLTGLCAGNIFVVVKDNNGCLANSVVVITQPTALTATYTVTNPTCPDVCDGQIQVNSASGGTPSYQYSVNGGPFQVSNILTGLCNGPSTVVVQDSHGCQITSNQTLTDPPAFTVTQTSMIESNCGFNNGSFQVSATGGFTPYTYNCVTLGVSNSTGSFTSLVAGSYEVDVTDNHGCMQPFFAGVNDIEMSGILDATTNVTCHGACDGTVMTHATGGFAPIQYELDGSGSFMLSGDFTGLCAGSHIVLMVDNGFCIYTQPFTITEPAEIFFNVATTNIACSGGATGSITVNSVTGGTAGYQYSNDGGVTFQASNVFSGLAAGTYNIVVKDVNGCTGNGTATITAAPPITFTTNVQDLTCFANNTGFLQIVASGGTGAFTYSKDGGATFGSSFTFVSLAAGTYNIEVKDAAGCIVSGTATINQPAALSASYSQTPALCNGSCDGSITVTAAGGTTPYEYSSDNGATYQVSNTLPGLCAGAYQVVVKDSNNCLIGSSVSISEPAVIAYTTSLTPSTCGNPNGVIAFNPPSGGTPGYQYSIDGGTTFVPGSSFTGLAAGAYNITVEDANNCQIDAAVTILNQASPTILTGFVTDVDCNGACNGTMSSTASGGTGTLTFDIGGAGQTTGSFSSICAGSYTLTVTDSNGCTDTQPFTVTEPTALSFTSTTTNLLCFNDNSGQISITATGGTTPYLYSYDGGGTFVSLSTQTDMAAGTYNLIVKDDHGCQATATQTLTEPAALTIASQSHTDASCFGICDGTATVAITGGTGAYTYTWSGGVASTTSSSASALCAGGYTLDVNDANGCTVNTSFNVTEPPQVIITGFSSTDALCNGSCDGTIDITAPLAVSYSVDGGATFVPTSSFSSLCPGTYNIVVKDAAGCPANTTATINEPTAVVQDPIADITICYDGAGTLNANATGGTPPYTYTWNTGAITQYYTVTSHVPVTYTCTVTDLNGCVSNSQSANVSVLPQFVPTVSADVTICPGGTATFTAGGSAGVPGYDFMWLDAANDTIGIGPNLTFTPSGPGPITLIASDQCPTIDTLTVNVFNYPLPQPMMPTPQWGCSPLITTLTNITDSTTAVTWDFGDGSPTDTSNTTISHTYINAGCYDVTMTVTSNHGCVNDSTFTSIACVYPNPVVDFTYTPVNPNILQPNVDFVNLTLNGVSFDWDFAGLDSSTLENPSFNFNMVEAGEYMVCLSVISNQGCTGDTCKPVTILDQFLIYVPNAFTPDGDGVNEIFLPSVRGIDADGYEFMIFDRWGELIFQTTDKLKGWDGTFKNIQVKEDVYVWKIKAKKSDNEDVKEYFGHVTLLR